MCCCTQTFAPFKFIHLRIRFASMLFIHSNIWDQNKVRIWLKHKIPKLNWIEALIFSKQKIFKFGEWNFYHLPLCKETVYFISNIFSFYNYKVYNYLFYYKTKCYFNDLKEPFFNFNVFSNPGKNLAKHCWHDQWRKFLQNRSHKKRSK